MVLSSYPVLRQVNTASLCVGSLSRVAANPDPRRLVLEEEFLEEPSWAQLKCRSTERSGHLPDITQLRSGSTERSGNLPKYRALKWKHREVKHLA